jgi:hypothetical protein
MTQKKCRMQNTQSPRSAAPARAVSDSHWHCRLLSLGLLCCAWLFTPLGAAQTPYEQRTDAFRRLLFELRFQPLRTFAELQVNPRESVFLMLGEPTCLSQRNFPEGLRAFVERGGAVLIATDMETAGEAGENLRKLAGVMVTGETLIAARSLTPEKNHLFLYNNSKYCPFVESLEDTNIVGLMTAVVGMDGRPQLFRRCAGPRYPPLRVAANAPSRLKPTGWALPGGIYRLARLPYICTVEKDLAPRFRDEKGSLFAVGGTLGKGRVVVLADHSIFINRMILPQDNDNLEFAVNCLHWLRGSVETPMEALRTSVRSQAERGNEEVVRSLLTGQRHKVLFWDDGAIRSDFEAPLQTVPMPAPHFSEPTFVAALDEALAKLEANDSFNRALLERMDELPGGRQRLIHYAMYLLTLAALLLLGHRFLWRTRHHPELAIPSLAKVLRAHEPKASLLEQRRRALLRSGNVWELAHYMAQECFASAGVPLTGAAPPRVVMAQASRWQRWRAHRRMIRLWRLARSEVPTSLSLAAFRRLAREWAELKTALANGTMALNADYRNNG